MRCCVQDGPAEGEAAAAQSQPAADSAGEAAQSGAQRRSRASIWEGKASIVDQVNELVGELPDIDSNIALHVCPHPAFMAQ